MSAKTALVKCTVRGTEDIQRIHKSHPFLLGIDHGKLCWHNLDWTNQCEHNGTVQEILTHDQKSSLCWNQPCQYQPHSQAVVHCTVCDRKLGRSLGTRLVISSTHLHDWFNGKLQASIIQPVNRAQQYPTQSIITQNPPSTLKLGSSIFSWQGLADNSIDELLMLDMSP